MTAPADPPAPNRRARGLARRQLIMDAAEEVFSEKGYYGSSLRDVSQRSGAALGVISHHFRSKEVLFAEVVMRRRDQLLGIVSASLAAVAPQDASDHSAIEAFIRPFLRACAERHNEIRNYIRLTSHFMSTYAVPEVAPALAQLIPISHLLVDALRQHAPGLSSGNLKIAAYLIEAALVFMVQDTGFLDAMSEGAFATATINELISPAATFFCGGLRALAV